MATQQTALRFTRIGHLASLIVLVFSVSELLFAATETRVIPIEYTHADSILDSLAPHIGANANVSAHKNQLILSGEIEKLNELELLIKQLDQPPNDYRVKISFKAPASIENSGKQVVTTTSTQPDVEFSTSGDTTSFIALSIDKPRVVQFAKGRRFMAVEMKNWQPEEGFFIQLQKQGAGMRIALESWYPASVKSQAEPEIRAALLRNRSETWIKPDQWQELSLGNIPQKTKAKIYRSDTLNGSSHHQDKATRVHSTQSSNERSLWIYISQLNNQ